MVILVVILKCRLVTWQRLVVSLVVSVPVLGSVRVTVRVRYWTEATVSLRSGGGWLDRLVERLTVYVDCEVWWIFLLE